MIDRLFVGSKRCKNVTFYGLLFADGGVRVASAPTNHKNYTDHSKDNLCHTDFRNHLTI